MSEQALNDHNPLVQKALAVREQIRTRFENGQLVYERDMRNLAHELDLMYRLGETFVVGRLFTLMGAIEFHRGNFIAAYDFTQSALFCYEEVQDPRQITTTLSNMGEIYRQWGRHDEALDYYEKAHDMALQAEFWDLVALTLNNIGLVYMRDNQPEQALPMLEESLAYGQKGDRDSGIESETYSTIAQAHLALGNLEQAWAAALRALEISEQTNQVFDLGAAYRTLGIVAAEASDRDEDPAPYFERSREIFRVNDAQAEYAHTLVAEARWLRAEGRSEAAQTNLKQAEALFAELRLPDEVAMAHHMLAEIEKTAG